MQDKALHIHPQSFQRFLKLFCNSHTYGTDRLTALSLDHITLPI